MTANTLAGILQRLASGSADDPLAGEGISEATGSGDAAVPRNLAGKRSYYRKLAARSPGQLTELGLRAMREFIIAADGQIEDGAQPICVRYLLTTFLPQHPLKSIGTDMFRQMRTLSEALDALLAGRHLAAMDILMQRLKACQAFCIDKSWSGARWLELIPPTEGSTVLQPAEEELIKSIELGDLRLADLIDKLKHKG